MKVGRKFTRIRFPSQQISPARSGGAPRKAVDSVLSWSARVNIKRLVPFLWLLNFLDNQFSPATIKDFPNPCLEEVCGGILVYSGQQISSGFV